METFSALLAICAGNSPVSGEFPAQRPVTRSFDVFFDLRMNERLSKHSWGWCIETPSRQLWRQSNTLISDGIHVRDITMQWNMFQYKYKNSPEPELELIHNKSTVQYSIHFLFP